MALAVALSATTILAVQMSIERQRIEAAVEEAADKYMFDLQDLDELLEIDHEDEYEDEDEDEDDDDEKKMDDSDILECDDCNIMGKCFYEDIGMDQEVESIYWDLGEPDRCKECFNKWKQSEMAAEFLEEIQSVENKD